MHWVLELKKAEGRRQGAMCDFAFCPLPFSFALVIQLLIAVEGIGIKQNSYQAAH
jgi:hypothetical protein